MDIIEPEAIPPWLYEEVEEYFIPLPFDPRSILDIGANIGAFAQRAHNRWPQARIICCEPMPFNVCHLRRNVPDSVTVISAAVREHSGVDEIFIGDNFVTGGFFQSGRQTQQKILVECIAAKELPSCELVKIDTEGCEVEIIKNLLLKKTRVIFLEHHSRTDAETIKAILAPEFDLLGGDTGEAIGTFAFLRK
jgi:FkbM family methyltransferase